MRKGFIRFLLGYWIILLSIIAFRCYQTGRKYLQTQTFATGKVIDQVRLRQQVGLFETVDRMRPQIIFPVGDTSYIFTDEHTTLANGEIPRIIYPADNPRNARVYDYYFWIDTGIIVPYLLIGGFLFAIIRIEFFDKDKTPVIWKGTLDEFTGRRQS